MAVVGVYSADRATKLPWAYIAPAAGYPSGPGLETELTSWLHQKVTPHKRLRGGLRFVEAIPKSAAGKMLRRVLAEEANKEQSAKS